MRTAETGGTKLIYNGPVKDGKCDKINDCNKSRIYQFYEK